MQRGESVFPDEAPGRNDSDNANIYYLLGVKYSQSGDDGEAIEAFRKAISINPRHYYAYNDLGASYSDLGMEEEAVESFKKAVSINPDFLSVRTAGPVSCIPMNIRI